MKDWEEQLGSKAIDELASAKILSNPEKWKTELGNDTKNWLSFELSKRVHSKLTELSKMLEYKETAMGIFTATAYDLSVASCGKTIDNPAYGLTASGYSLKGLTMNSAMSIAADKKYPFGTRFRIEFDAPYTHMSGVYTVRDRGGAIKDNKIDIFFGDSGKEKPSKEALEFGIRTCRVYIIT